MALHETRMRTLQEMEALNFFCCTEGERAQQLRIDELSRQEKESQSTVNHLVVQIQEVQDKVNSLKVSMDFVDLETPSSSLLTRVPSHPVIVPSLCGMLSRDSCLQLDTRNLHGTQETFLKIYLHRMNRQQLVLEMQDVLYIHIAPGSLQLGILPLMQKEFIRKIVWLNNRGIRSRKCISINSPIVRHFSVGNRASRPRYVPDLTFPHKLCCGSKKWRCSNQRTI